MLGPDSIVRLSQFRWDGAWRITHFMARHLADYLSSLFVEPRPVPAARSDRGRPLLTNCWPLSHAHDCQRLLAQAYCQVQEVLGLTRVTA